MRDKLTGAKVVFFTAVAGAEFWRKLAEELRQLGHDVEIFSALEDDDYRRPRSWPSRLWLRWRVGIGFAARAVRHARRWSSSENGSRVLVLSTNPFFLPWLVERCTRGQERRTVLLLFDVYPDAWIAAGGAESGWVAKRMAAITGAALRNCTATVFLGERIRRSVEERYGKARISDVIPVGAGGRWDHGVEPWTAKSPACVTVLYAGLMGRMHEVETLVTALAGPLPLGVQLRFHASGAGYGELRRRIASQPRVSWGGPLDRADWAKMLVAAEVGLVTLRPGAERAAMPSKTYSALLAGQAILAVCAADSDLANLVRRHACGWVVTPGDALALRRALSEIAEDREGLQAKRQRSLAAGRECYDSVVVARQWDALLRQLTRLPEMSASPQS